MAVFTEVSESKAQELLTQLQLGDLVELKGIQGGIENTNYFLTSSAGAYVLTLFERLTHQQLPFYLHLMKHLAHHGIPVPDPVANSDGNILLTLEGKPAAVVNRLIGRSELAPTPLHCHAVGDMLARMHLAGKDYSRHQPNLRGLAWWNETVPVVLPFLSNAQNRLIQSELAFQNHVAHSSAYAALPRGPVHADLFRDNVMFEGTGNALQLTERQLLNPMLRAGALRFWTSRLWDFHLPRKASMLSPHDPSHFERVLRQRLAQPIGLST